MLGMPSRAQSLITLFVVIDLLAAFSVFPFATATCPAKSLHKSLDCGRAGGRPWSCLGSRGRASIAGEPWMRAGSFHGSRGGLAFSVRAEHDLSETENPRGIEAQEGIIWRAAVFRWPCPLLASTGWHIVAIVFCGQYTNDIRPAGDSRIAARWCCCYLVLLVAGPVVIGI